MRHIKFTCFLLVIGFTANAQFSIQPQVGIENSRTTIQYNDQSFAPMGTQLSPKVALRIDYKFKPGHGPFVGISTSSPAIDFKFSDPQTAATSYKASRQNLQLRFEGGYQLSTKPIYFSKPAKSSTSSFKSHHQYRGGEKFSYREKNSCGKSMAVKSCGKNSNKKIAKNKGSYMRILPSAGLAYIPSQPDEIETSRTNYTYNAGAWKTAFIAGTGFEFGSKRSAKFIVNINYLKGLDNMDTKTINSISNDKAVAHTLSSKSSSWSVSLGVPLSLSKKEQKMTKQFERTYESKKCGQYQKPKVNGKCGQYKSFMM